jgi:hypothetical protein
MVSQHAGRREDKGEGLKEMGIKIERQTQKE